MAATGSTNNSPASYRTKSRCLILATPTRTEARKMSSQRLITHSLTGYYSVIIRFKKNFIAVHSMEVLWNGVLSKDTNQKLP